MLCETKTKKCCFTQYPSNREWIDSSSCCVQRPTVPPSIISSNLNWIHTSNPHSQRRERKTEKDSHKKGRERKRERERGVCVMGFRGWTDMDKRWGAGEWWRWRNRKMFTDALPNRAERNCIRTRLTPPPISHTCTYLPLKVHTNIYILSINSHSSYSNSINSNIWLFIGRMGFFYFQTIWGWKRSVFFMCRMNRWILLRTRMGE